MSTVDRVCKKMSLERASEQLSAIMIYRQLVLPVSLTHAQTLPLAVLNDACKFGIDVIFLDFRVIMHDMQALIKKEISPSRMRKYYSGEILF